MTRRNSGIAADSLELLLDTICNTFGAVIFISMLVAILVQRGPAETPVAEQVDPETRVKETEQQIEAAKERLRVLTLQQHQQEVVTSRFSSSESIELATELKRNNDAIVILTNQEAEASSDIHQTLGQIVQLEQRHEKAKADYQTTKDELSNFQQQLTEQQQLVGRTARIPRLRKTTKDSVVYALDDGRLFQVTTKDLRIDTTDCERLDVDQKIVIRLRPTAGIPILLKGSNDAAKQKFRGMSTKDFFIQLFVARDSFEQFLPLKDAIVAAGYEYEVRIMDGDDVELILGDDAQDSFVQ